MNGFIVVESGHFLLTAMFPSSYTHELLSGISVCGLRRYLGSLKSFLIAWATCLRLRGFMMKNAMISATAITTTEIGAARTGCKLQVTRSKR